MTQRPLSELIAERIEKMRGDLRLTQEAVAEGSLMSRTNYVNKTTRAKGTQPFSVEQIEAIAAYFRRVTGKELLGWPFVDEETSEDLEKVRALMRR